MKVLILAGGFGTRLSEETDVRPKPMVEIGGRPILWHIMKCYAQQGFSEFVVLLGYRGYYIKEYFANYFLHQSDVTFDLGANRMHVHNSSSEDWKVTLLDTGRETMTGGRVRRAGSFIGRERFLLTYGDGLSDVNVKDVIRFHEQSGATATLTAVQPEGRFGALVQSPDGHVCEFKEKPEGDGSWINGGFFVCEPTVLDYIQGDATVFEREPMENMAAEGKLAAYRHSGFWKCMDTLRDKMQLNELWANGSAPWKIWKD
ncbi:MAG: glucose-1-phosphate cytidylyltransferase [Lysobacterales bacterium]